MTESTPAIEAIAASGVDHEVLHTARAHSAEEAADLRGVPLRALIKTIVVRLGDDAYALVLVPGDRAMDWPKLRTHFGVRRISLPDADEALEATGYARGTITPFGTTRPWPVVMDAALADEPLVAIGGGAHGVALRLAAADLAGATEATIADVTKPAQA